MSLFVNFGEFFKISLHLLAGLGLAASFVSLFDPVRTVILGLQMLGVIYFPANWGAKGAPESSKSQGS